MACQTTTGSRRHPRKVRRQHSQWCAQSSGAAFQETATGGVHGWNWMLEIGIFLLGEAAQPSIPNPAALRLVVDKQHIPYYLWILIRISKLCLLQFQDLDGRMQRAARAATSCKACAIIEVEPPFGRLPGKGVKLEVLCQLFGVVISLPKQKICEVADQTTGFQRALLEDDFFNEKWVANKIHDADQEHPKLEGPPFWTRGVPRPQPPVQGSCKGRTPSLGGVHGWNWMLEIGIFLLGEAAQPSIPNPAAANNISNVPCPSHAEDAMEKEKGIGKPQVVVTGFHTKSKRMVGGTRDKGHNCRSLNLKPHVLRFCVDGKTGTTFKG